MNSLTFGKSHSQSHHSVLPCHPRPDNNGKDVSAARSNYRAVQHSLKGRAPSSVRTTGYYVTLLSAFLFTWPSYLSVASIKFKISLHNALGKRILVLMALVIRNVNDEEVDFVVSVVIIR